MNSRELYDMFAGESHFALPSYMQGVGESDKITLEECLYNLSRSKELTVVKQLDSQGAVQIEYRGEIYGAVIKVDKIYDIKLTASHHPISKSEFDAIEVGDSAITVGVEYSRDSLLSYQMQLKLITTLITDLKVIIDLSLGTVLSGEWAAVVANSEVTPDVKYLYSIDMKMDSESVWIHTHGLLRSGSPEFEILDIPRVEGDIYPEREVLDTIAKSVIDREIDCSKPDTPFDIGYDLTGVWREWEPIVTNDQREIKESLGHIDPTGVVCLSQGDNLYHVSAAREFLLESPLNYFTPAENRRRSDLALERLPLMLKSFNKGGFKAFVKHGVVADDTYQEIGSKSRREFIWFKLVKVEDSVVTGVAIADATAVERITKGSNFSFDIDLIDDWQLISENGDTTTPDSSYLL